MARGLLTRILAHGFERGYWRRGELLADPFGGVFTTGILCASAGLRCVGVELEGRFVELAQANIELHRQVWERCGDPLPVIVQGDSRNFAEIIRGQLAACVTSPPYATGDTAGPESLARRKDSSAAAMLKAQRWGVGGQVSEGNVASLPAGNVEAVITSPPYESTSALSEMAPPENKLVRLHLPPAHEVAAYLATRRRAKGLSKRAMDDMLGTNTMYSFYEGRKSRTEIPTPAVWNRLKAILDLDGRFDHGILTVEKVEATGRLTTNGRGLNGDYGTAPGQVGVTSGESYWSAMRTIYGQVFQALHPGGVLCCVLKNYVAKKKVVPLTDQTAALLEHLGFRVVTRVRAMLVKETRGNDLFGGQWVEKVGRKSFFRRLYEKKYPQNAIDWEEAIWARKP